MNIKKTLWVAAACTLATIAGCTNGQGPTTVAGTLQITNSSQSNLTVIQGTEFHPLAPNARVELPINSRSVTVARTSGNADKIERVVLEFNPGQCPFNLCLLVH
ncbi:hypothetical protein [Pseudomonas sp. MIACH]|jgi:hypothetical protein|uniref:hypothetical protein n=1 Tax=Pseudomonas sp. MIACH TaxID=1078355 RepID=UPI00069F4620|nr:hypothetical protein [Pseudomonas sp. MIACH]